LSLVVFTLFNLFLSAGIRDLLVRLFARRVVREVLIFVFVIAAGLPQVLVLTGAAANAKKMVAPFAHLLWPWTATAVLAQGHFTAADAGALAAWTVAAYFFGRSQFERGLRFDVDEVSARKGSGVWKSPLEGFFRFPSRLFADPLAVLIEKELRILARSARFRLVFIMGFSFGLLIWLPLAFGPSGSQGGWLSRNYLTLVSGYALVLLGDVLFWNVFGFDRSAAQIYFVAPVRIQTVLKAKNLAAFIYICIEVGLISMVCALLRFPVSPGKIVEAYAVTFTIALLLMGAGNLSSVYNPRAIDPSKSFRNSAGRQTQAALMLVFPIAFAPVALAYAARFAFDSNVAFYLTLLFSIAFAAVLYRVSMQSVVGASERRKEAIILALTAGQSPIAS
jgi:ABC-2 type transport system permease protein